MSMTTPNTTPQTEKAEKAEKPGLTWEMFNPQNKKVILSIDGGGMRGIIPLAMLCYLEAAMDKPAYEMFDLVAGTSTGAVIAAGLALGMRADEILQVYLNDLPKAFGARDWRFWMRYLFGYGLRYQYPWQPFLDTLSKIPGANTFTIGDLAPEKQAGKKRPIILLTTKDLRTTNTYYIVSAGPGKEKFQDWPLNVAVSSSSAATTFFRPVDGNLVDGGVGAFGNPCLASAVQAFEYIGSAPEYSDFRPDNAILISLGTGYVDSNLKPHDGYRRGLIGWAFYLILGTIVENAIQQTLMTRALYGEKSNRHPDMHLDFRRFNVNLTRDVVEKVLGLTPGNLNPEDLTLDTTAADQLNLMVDIGKKYAELIDWTKPHQLPWGDPQDPTPERHIKAGQPQPGIHEEKPRPDAFDFPEDFGLGTLLNILKTDMAVKVVLWVIAILFLALILFNWKALAIIIILIGILWLVGRAALKR